MVSPNLRILFKILSAVLAVTVCAQPSQAFFGYGMAPMMGMGCQQQPARGARHRNDHLDELKRRRNELTRELKRVQLDLKRAQARERAYEKAIDDTLDIKWANMTKRILRGDVIECEDPEIRSQVADAKEMDEFCACVGDRICYVDKFTKKPRSGDPGLCREALGRYGESQNEVRRLQDILAQMKDEEAYLRDEIGYARSNRDDLEADCPSCRHQGRHRSDQSSGMDTLLNVGLGLGSLYMGYKLHQQAITQNARLGWPTQGYGYPFAQAGAYGAIAAMMGSGGFGCGSDMGGMMSMMMMMSMMGGMGGMGGMGMMGMPGGGMFMPGMMPGMMGMPGMLGGMAGLGMMPGMMPGMGMMGMPGMGMMPGMMPMASPYGTMYGMGGMGMMGMPGMGVPGIVPGIMPGLAGGMPMGGMLGGMGGLGMMPMGGMMPGMGGMGMMGGMYGGNALASLRSLSALQVETSLMQYRILGGMSGLGMSPMTPGMGLMPGMMPSPYPSLSPGFTPTPYPNQPYAR